LFNVLFFLICSSKDHSFNCTDRKLTGSHASSIYILLLKNICALQSLFKQATKEFRIMKKNNSPEIGYTLKHIMAFAANDPPGIYRILESFAHSTSNNLAHFRRCLNERNYQMLRELAHKMNSMFRQLEAFQLVTLLKKIEEPGNDKLTGKELDDLGMEFLNKAEQFIGVLCEEQNIRAVTLNRNS
jgi:hypothetical protein